VAKALNLPLVTIGGVKADVTFAGVLIPGLFQVNVVIPPLPAGDQVLRATIGGVATPQGVYLPIAVAQ
jgi:uncharacterized protein (TIGR03437 family)